MTIDGESSADAIRTRHRLYWHIYLSFVGVVVLFALLALGAWSVRPADSPGDSDDREWIAGVSAVLGDLLSEEGQRSLPVEQRVRRLATQLDVQLALYDSKRQLLVATVPNLPEPGSGAEQSRLIGRREGGPGAVMALPDGRWLVARRSERRTGAFPLALLLLGLAIAAGSYPLARRITRRLEALQSATRKMAGGDLSARARVRGRDEIASLASSFNRAAERIEQLVQAQRSTLAAASHELRSPLARLRMAIELYSTAPDSRIDPAMRVGDDIERSRLKQRIEQDIAELDSLIEELLLTSRLASGTALDGLEQVDLLALAAEEGARVQADVSGVPVVIRGSPRLLRRALRNLLDNASRYAAGTRIDVRVLPLAQTAADPASDSPSDGAATILVEDSGPGVPESIREHIFRSFYRPAGMAEGSGGGVGLGLALVRDIARRHGGDVQCVAASGGGTRMQMVLRSIGSTQAP